MENSFPTQIRFQRSLSQEVLDVFDNDESDPIIIEADPQSIYYQRSPTPQVEQDDQDSDSDSDSNIVSLIHLLRGDDQPSNTNDHQTTDENNLTSTEVPSQLIITDLDPPSISYHVPSSNNQNQPTAMTPTIDPSPTPRSPIPPSLARRILATLAAHNLDPTSLDRNSRRQFFDQMIHDFQNGMERSEAVNRFRQHMNQLTSLRQSASTTTRNNHTTHHQSSRSVSSATPSPSTHQFGSRNLVEMLHQVRSQRNLLSRVRKHYTYLLYCGYTPDHQPTNSSNQHLNSRQGSSSSSSSITENSNHQSDKPFRDHRVCGRLITIRGTLLNLKPPTRDTMYYEDMGDSYSNMSGRSVSDHLFFTSDSDPLPGSVDLVDNITQEFVDTDPSNFFHRGSSDRDSCSCQRKYLGCLSCGNIVGHTVTTLCRHCQDRALIYRHFYYLNRLTSIPRFINGPISLELQNVQVRNGSSDLNLMTWTQALLRKKSDTDAGYVGDAINDQSPFSALNLFADGLEAGLPPRLTERIRNAILMGSVDVLLEDSMDMPRNRSTVDSSPFNTAATSLVNHQVLSLVNPPHLPMSPNSSFLPPTMRRSSINSSSRYPNRLSSSAINNNRFVRAGLTRRPAVRISQQLGIWSGPSSRSAVRGRPSSTSTPESWLTLGRTDFPQDENEEEAEVKEEAQDEELFTDQLVHIRRPRIDDDDDENDVRREEQSMVGSSGQDTRDRGLNQNQSSSRNITDNRISSRVIRRRIHRNLDHHNLSSSHRDDQVDYHTLVRFNSNFTWSGDVCAR